MSANGTSDVLATVITMTFTVDSGDMLIVLANMREGVANNSLLQDLTFLPGFHEASNVELVNSLPAIVAVPVAQTSNAAAIMLQG